MQLGGQMKSLDDAMPPRVVLFLGAADEYLNRVQLSSGTMAAPTVTPSGLYEDGAMIPRPDWRGLTRTDRKALIAESCPTFCGNAISVIGLPSDLLEPFHSLRAAAAGCLSKEQLLPIIDSNDCSKGTDALFAYLQHHLQCSNIDEDGALQGGIAAHLPRLQTITADPKTDAFVGLHIDNFYAFQLTRREYSPNRVCVNLGAEDRFFLFMNIPMRVMYGLMNNKLSGEKHFMTLFPSYPVVRVRIRPGEAYIAPTENIVHDGSSIDMNAMDVTLSVRGRFGLCPK
jgi:hypothetical protein